MLIRPGELEPHALPTANAEASVMRCIQLITGLNASLTYLSLAKGFGFIKPDDGGEDLFCHVSSITNGIGRMLTEGAAVQFVKKYDERTGKERAEEVTSGVEEDSYGGGGGGSGGGGGLTGPLPDWSPTSLTGPLLYSSLTSCFSIRSTRGRTHL